MRIDKLLFEIECIRAKTIGMPIPESNRYEKAVAFWINYYKTNNKIGPEIVHEQWLINKEKEWEELGQKWSYGYNYDSVNFKHPLYIAYNNLPTFYKEGLDIFVAAIKAYCNDEKTEKNEFIPNKSKKHK